MIATKKANSLSQKWRKNFTTWLKEFKERFSKVVTGFSYKDKIKVKIVDKNVKINFKYCQKHILTPIFKYGIADLNPECHQTVELHRDKARSHTSQSRIPFLEKIVQDTGIKTIPFTDFPVKSPDASPKDFCAFGLLNLHYLNADLQCFVDFGKLLERSGTKKNLFWCWKNH